MSEIQTKDKLITLEELGAAIDAKAGVTSVNNQTGAVSLTPANIGAVAKSGDTMTGPLTATVISTINALFPLYQFLSAPGVMVADMYYDIGSKNFVFRYDPNGAEEHYVLPSSTGSGGHYILTDKSPVTVPQGGTGATTAAVTITNDYSSVLNAINAVKNTRIFPISIQKNGTSFYSDMPSGFENHEWNLLLFGDANRITALLHMYNTPSLLYVRTFYSGNWLTSWIQLH